MDNSTYDPMQSVSKGLPAIIVGAIAAVAAGFANGHGIQLDSGTVGAVIMGLYGIVNGTLHYFQNRNKPAAK
jgi:hypothetical protein